MTQTAADLQAAIAGVVAALANLGLLLGVGAVVVLVLLAARWALSGPR